MTYEELVKEVRKNYGALDASGIKEHVAVQFNIEGEAEGGTDKTSVKVGTDPTDDTTFLEVAHGEEINFKNAGCTVGSGVTDSGELTVPVWIDIVDIPLTADVENTIQISYLAGGYSYYLCGARVVYHG